MIDVIIATLATAQNGVVARAQLLAAGVSPDAIAWRVKTGRLHPVHRGIYLVGHNAPPPLARERAALLACGESTLLSHRTAARLWRLLPEPPRRDPVDVMVAGRQCGRPAGVRVHRTRVIDAKDRRQRDGLELTSPARTLLDLASESSDRELDRALNEARVHRLLGNRELTDVLGRANGRHGAPRLAALIRLHDGPALTRSEAERRLLELIRAAGLPEPETNVRLFGFEVDFLWRSHNLVVEVDGFAFHATPRAFERDHDRNRVLEDAGVTVKRVTWRQIVEEPYATIATIASALARGRMAGAAAPAQASRPT